MSALKQLLFNMADDLLIIGHRNSEWTGIGPVLEEDIAFASMAQDKIGQAQALYQLIHEGFNTESPDLLGFNRKENEFYSCHFVELPIGEYDFSLVRHFLFDQAQFLRMNDLKDSSHEELKAVSLVLDGKLLPASDISKLAELPTQDQARAMLLGILASPATQLLRLLNEPASMLSRTMSARGNG